jgi:D-3-phosphoglycerate dehydrogenase
VDILISEELQAPAVERLEKKYAVQREPGLWKDAVAFKEKLRDARVVMVRNQTQVTAEALEGAPRLIAVGRVGVGLDNIDVAAASRLGITVVAPLNANATSVAELALGLMLALARKIPQADRSTKAGQWDRKGCTGVELAGKTLAVCGFGRIGTKVGQLGRAFGMELAVFDPFLQPDSPAVRESGAQLYTSLEQALAIADVVSLHLPLTQETRKLFDARRFAAFKPGALLVNTSRGAVVDEFALIGALQSRILAGAGLDVRELEPPVVNILESMPNVILTPHIGAFTVEAQQRTFEAVANDVDRLLSGQPAKYFVNFERPKRSG